MSEAAQYGLIKRGWLVKVGGMYYPVYQDAVPETNVVHVRERSATVWAVDRAEIQKVIQVES